MKQAKAQVDLRQTKHRQVFQHIHRAIVEGQYTAGQKLPTDSQLMRRFDTSRPTVARAMRDLEQAGLVERRPGSGSYVRIPAVAKTSLLGLLIPGLGETEIFEPICGELARSCQRLNFNLLWGDSSAMTPHDQEQQAEALARRYVEQRVAGVFFAPVELTTHMREVNRRVATLLDRAGIVVILLDRDIEDFPERSKFDLVGIDNFRAGYAQAKHLLRAGCTQVHYLARPKSAMTVEARIAGYQHALKDHGIVADEGWVHRGEPDDPVLVGAIIEQRPDAVLCANDITAGRFMRCLIQLGLRVPHDIRVMGVDDVKYAQLFSVPLTTLRQPCREMGAAAVHAMIQRLENREMPARDIFVDFQLIVRESCGGCSVR